MGWKEQRWRKRQREFRSSAATGRCGATRKVCFSTAEQALQRCHQLQRINSSNGQVDRPVPSRAYQCKFCGQFHITSSLN